MYSTAANKAHGADVSKGSIATIPINNPMTAVVEVDLSHDGLTCLF
jgi:hypothetical protein